MDFRPDRYKRHPYKFSATYKATAIRAIGTFQSAFEQIPLYL